MHWKCTAVKNVSNEKDIQSNRGMCYCYTNIKIITEHPECANIDLLVKFWETKGDSLVSEIAKEQIYDCELTEYLKLHPEENN